MKPRHKHNLQIDFKGYAHSGIGHCTICGDNFMVANDGSIAARVHYKDVNPKNAQRTEIYPLQ